MFQCEICQKVLKNSRGLSGHVKTHGLTSEAYKIKFGIIKFCPDCNKQLLLDNKTGFCGSCRDRTGENNPFYGKHHSDIVKSSLSETSSVASLLNWQNDEYREKVLKGTVGKKRSDSFKETQSKNTTRQMADDSQRELRSKAMKESWELGLIPLSKNTSMNSSKGEKEIIKTLSDFYNIEVKTLHIGGNYFYPDMIIEDRLIIEYNGDYWHANPNKYNKDFIIERSKQKAEDIWKRDEYRISKFKSIGYEVLVVWESEYKANPKETINIIRKRIKECLKEN